MQTHIQSLDQAGTGTSSGRLGGIKSFVAKIRVSVDQLYNTHPKIKKHPNENESMRDL